MSEAFVYHFVMTRGKQQKERGERLATACFPPELVERLGLPAVRSTVEAQRRSWVKAIRAGGYSAADGYSVNVVLERGFRRSLYPVPAAIQVVERPALILPAGQKEAN
jgi:hypothetical protein